MSIDPTRLCGESGDGERGEHRDGEVDLDVIRRNAGLDGDLDRDLRSCLIAEAESML